MKNRNIDTDYQKITNVCVVTAAVFLCVTFFIYTFISEANLSKTLIGLGLIIVMVLLTYAYKNSRDSSTMAFLAFFILLLFFIALLSIGGWYSSYFLFACLCYSGIVFLFSIFRKIMQMVVLNILIGILFFIITPYIEPDMPVTLVLFIWLTSMFTVIIMLSLARSATVTQAEAFEDQNSFHNLLTTTGNYVAMVDESNKVVYLSKTLAQLAKIEDPELTKGRLLIDLFEGRDLKLLTGKMLSHKESYAGDWEFMLDGQKRFFRVTSNTMAGSSKTVLINLQDLTSLAERDEIAVMKDSLRIGLFFMDRNYIIQDHYSRFLEELLVKEELQGKSFIDLLSASLNHSELNSVRDYFDMLFDRVFDQTTLEDINPLTKLYYVNAETGDKKIFHCTFTTIDRGTGEISALVSLYDITVETELQQRIVEEEAKRQEEMATLFELFKVEQDVFSDFMEDAEHEFTNINKILRNEAIATHDILVMVYQSVHAIKSNAVIVGLETFGNKLHTIESGIKKLREQEAVSFDEMFALTLELEKLFKERDKFEETIQKIRSFKSGSSNSHKRGSAVMVESFVKAASKAAEDNGKKVQFVVDDMDSEAIERGPRRIMKDVLMQLVRNSVVHGIEAPGERLARGKNETGKIRLSIKLTGEIIQVKLGDDGNGLDFGKIAEKALHANLIKKEDLKNKEMLLKAIFSPGFSTAETEGVHAGRGIGLNLVRDRVREAKGSIKVQTESGKGTVFIILFPAGPKLNIQ
jgi:two-component system chemotaxis sensor kinase CheA